MNDESIDGEVLDLMLRAGSRGASNLRLASS